eukprot:m.1526828 g.1526828  ORF g.1526828 m.1526828 type:complete len:93 (+) comp25234_c0_seq51:3598-3876(+)
MIRQSGCIRRLCMATLPSAYIAMRCRNLQYRLFMTRRRLHRLVQFSFACDQIPFMLTALFDQNLLLPIPMSAFTLQLRHLFFQRCVVGLYGI